MSVSPRVYNTDSQPFWVHGTVSRHDNSFLEAHFKDI